MNLTGKKIVAAVVNAFLAVLLFWLLVNRPDAVLLTTVVLWLFAVAILGSVLYFLYWVPDCKAPNEVKTHELHHELHREPCESRAR